MLTGLAVQHLQALYENAAGGDCRLICSSREDAVPFWQTQGIIGSTGWDFMNRLPRSRWQDSKEMQTLLYLLCLHSPH